jgi:hypothetical protein
MTGVEAIGESAAHEPDSSVSGNTEDREGDAFDIAILQAG